MRPIASNPLLLLIGANILASVLGVISSLQNDLPFDENGRLQQHHILFTNACDRFAISRAESIPLMHSLEMTSEVASDLFDGPLDGCAAVYFTRGMARDMIHNVFPEHKFSGDNTAALVEWIGLRRKVEIGWISYHDNDCTVYWISPEGRRVQTATLRPGEKSTFWSQSFLGHEFAIEDSVTLEPMGTYVAAYESIFPVGYNKLFEATENVTKEDIIERELNSVYHETSSVKRTFSELGFKKGKLPKDIFASISAYIYNNKDHFTIEEQVRSSVFVNHWQSRCLFLGMPWGLKRMWQSKLMKMVQAWVGDHTPLEPTDIYGIRRYTEGARLLQHVDRINTHAVSLILNVDQEGVREPWFVEIYDFAGRLHEIEMQPGDIIYYESARCLHGRMRPLNGTSYTNIFSHYRPVGDDEWYERPNPPDAPEPLLDVGECWLDREAGRPVCEKADLPTLSPALARLQTSSDLFDWWKLISRPETDPRKLALAGLGRAGEATPSAKTEL